MQDHNGDTVMCELCGEAPAEIATDHVGMCGDCFGAQTHEALRDAGIGSFCCRPLFRDGNLTALCLASYGREHDHDSEG